MLEFRSVGVRYDAPLFSDVSFRLGEGETAALVGKNGAGKSTLLRCALSEVPHTGGVFYKGEDLAKKSARERANILSFLPQSLPAPALSVREVASFGFFSRVKRLSPAEWKQTDEMLERLGLSALAARPASSLSGGERQKVFLACLLLQDAPELLLDEPTTYMDLSFRAAFFSLLREEKKRGKTILIVLHDLSDAVAEADRILLLDGGGLAFDGATADCLAQNVLERAFSVRRYLARDDKDDRDESGEKIFFRP